jgi:hypothetical protein
MPAAGQQHLMPPCTGMTQALKVHALRLCLKSKQVMVMQNK